MFIFGGPFSDSPCRPQDLDWIVPKEYETNSRILEKLQKLDLNLYQEDTIFMLYYTHPRDILQIFTIQKLYNGGWRYHKQLKRWLKRHDDQKETIYDQQGGIEGESAQFTVFNPETWTRDLMFLKLYYSDLEGQDIAHTGNTRPQNSNNNAQNSQNAVTSQHQQPINQNQQQNGQNVVNVQNIQQNNTPGTQQQTPQVQNAVNSAQNLPNNATNAQQQMNRQQSVNNQRQQQQMYNQSNIQQQQMYQQQQQQQQQQTQFGYQKPAHQ